MISCGFVEIMVVMVTVIPTNQPARYAAPLTQWLYLATS